MKIILVVIACCVLTACQSTPAPMISSKPHVVQDTPTATLISLAIYSSDEVVLVGRLASIQANSGCGYIQYSTVAKYTNLQVISGTYPYDIVYVVHGCPELKRSEYFQGSGNLEAFNAGDYHELHLARENVYNLTNYPNGPYPKDHLYYSKVVDLYKQ